MEEEQYRKGSRGAVGREDEFKKVKRARGIVYRNGEQGIVWRYWRERKGEFVKVGYGKIFLEGRWRRWEEEQDRLEELEREGKKKEWRKEERQLRGGKGQDKEEKAKKAEGEPKSREKRDGGEEMERR